MKTIRQGTFETNSSSTHSLTMCMAEEYKKWEAGELYYLEANNSFVTPEERNDMLREMTLQSKFDYHYGGSKKPSTYTYKGVTVDWEHKSELLTKENLAEITDEDIKNYVDENFDRYEMPCTVSEYYDELEYETYKQTYTTPQGEKVVSFGYFGNDY